MLNLKRQSGSVTLVVLLALVFLIILTFSLNGWGYMGYYGYHRGPSLWYWGGPKVYHNPSLRSGSIGGPNVRGGGFSGGK